MGKAKSLLELISGISKSRKAVSRLPRPKSLAASLGLDEVALKKSGLLLPPAEDKVRLFRVQGSGGNELSHGIGLDRERAMGRWFLEDPRLTEFYSNRFRPSKYMDVPQLAAPHELTFTDFARGPHEQYRVSNMVRPRPQKPPYSMQDDPRSFSRMPNHEFFLPRGGFDLGGQIGLEGMDMDQTKALLERLSKQQGVVAPKIAESPLSFALGGSYRGNLK